MMPCKDGLVVVGDKLTKDYLRGSVDGTKKLAQADQFTIVSSTGNPTFFAKRLNSKGQVTVGEKLFDANDAVVSYFQSHKVQGSVYPIWQEVAVAIRTAFVNTFALRPIQYCPDERRDDNYALFQSVIFHSNPINRQFEVICLKFRYRKQAPLSIVFDNPAIALNPAKFTKSDFSCFGSTAVTDSLIKGERFREFNKDGLLDEALKSMPAANVTQSRALKKASRLITLSSLMLPLDTPNPVGRTVDAVIITPKSGVRWLYKNVSVKLLDH